MPRSGCGGKVAIATLSQKPLICSDVYGSFARPSSGCAALTRGVGGPSGTDALYLSTSFLDNVRRIACAYPTTVRSTGTQCRRSQQTAREAHQQVSFNQQVTSRAPTCNSPIARMAATKGGLPMRMEFITEPQRVRAMKITCHALM